MHKITWNWYVTKGPVPYVVIDLQVLFVNRNGSAIGVGAAGWITDTTTEDLQHAHRLRTSTLLDPASAAHRQAIEAWAAGPAPTMLFFVEENLRATSYLGLNSDSADKRIALENLADATKMLNDDRVVPGGFHHARAFMEESHSRVRWWY